MDLLLGIQNSHRTGNDIAHITTMYDKLSMAKSSHQFEKNPRSCCGIEASLMWPLREGKSRNRGHDYFKGSAHIFLLITGYSFCHQLRNDLVELIERSGKAVNEQQWNGGDGGVLLTDVHEMHLQTFNLRPVLWKGVQLCLLSSPAVVTAQPVLDDSFQHYRAETKVEAGSGDVVYKAGSLQTTLQVS